MTAWPSALPQTPLLAGFDQQEKDTAIRSSMSYGPDKVRRRTTTAIYTVQASIMLDTSEIPTLETFYRTTMQVSGTFTWINHVTGSAANYRFTGPPHYAALGGGRWLTALSLEIIP